MALSILSRRLVENFYPSTVFIFPFWVRGDVCEESPVIILDIARPCVIEF